MPESTGDITWRFCRRGYARGPRPLKRADQLPQRSDDQVGSGRSFFGSPPPAGTGPHINIIASLCLDAAVCWSGWKFTADRARCAANVFDVPLIEMRPRGGRRPPPDQAPATRKLTCARWLRQYGPSRQCSRASGCRTVAAHTTIIAGAAVGLRRVQRRPDAGARRHDQGCRERVHPAIVRDAVLRSLE
jgi:hypothetical protein